MPQPISDLKFHLHESIENINDEDTLRIMDDIANHQYNVVNEPTLNEYQINRIGEAKQQIAAGNFYTNEQANELINKWLSK
jgi:hypothetical protein